MAWDPLAPQPGGLAGPSGGGYGGPTRSPLPYSPSGFNFNGGGYSQRDLDDGLGDRPFKDVGKLNINLLDPLERQRAGDALGAGANWGLDDAPKTGLSFIDDYFEKPGGFFAGILGAVGGTFGQTGSDIGATLGKALEAPLGLVGGVGVPIPFADELNQGAKEHVPTLLQDIVRAPTNLGAVFESGLNAFGLLGRAVERTYAGFSQRGALPTDIQERIDAGELTEDEALDELVMSGRGFTDDPMHNLLFSMVLDPVNLLSLGTGAAIKAIEGTNKVARAISATGDLTRIANYGDPNFVQELAEVAAKADLGRITPGGLQTRSQLNAVRRMLAEGDNPILQLSRGERMGLAMFGPVSAENSSGFIRMADKAQRLTDPLSFFGGGSIAKRASHHLVTAGTAGVIAAYKPLVVHGLARTLEGLDPSYRDKLENALATYAANLVNRYVIDQVGSDALKQGGVPRISNGAQNVNPSELAKGLTEGGTYDISVGKHIEIMAERNKPVSLLTLSPEAVRNQTLNKLAEMTGASADELAAAIPNVDGDLAMLVHAAYFADRGTALARIAERLKAAPNAVKATLPADLVQNADRLAVVAERTLTKQRAAALEAAIAAKDMPLIRTLASKYSDFDWMAPAQMTDENLLGSLQGWMLDNKPGLPEEVQLFDPVTGLLRTDLPADLAAWAANADTFGYGVAIGPPKDLPSDVLWRMTKDENGKVIALNPWLDFVGDLPEGTQVNIPNRLAATRMQLTRGIRQDRILWSAKRKFAIALAAGDNTPGMARVPVEVATRIFDRLIVDASVQGVQVRGLRPDQMMGSAKKVLQQERERLGIGVQELTERQVLKAVLEAFNGDLSVVGATQRITGTVKQRAPGAGMNMWGQISEKLYPLMRFSLNPIFLAMETTEPYLLNYMRGIKTPMLRDKEGFQSALRAHVTMENMLRNATAPEGYIAEQAEYIRLLGYTNQIARAEFGSASKLGQLASRWRPDIARRKEAAQALQTKVLFGERMKAAFQRIKGDQFDDFWNGLTEHYRTVDDTEIAWRWANENLALADISGDTIHTMLQLQSPQAFGRQIRVTRYKTAGSLGFDDLEAAIDRHYAYDEATNYTPFAARANGRKHGDVLYDELRDGTMTKDDLVRHMNAIGVENTDHIDTIWYMATGPDVEDFWKSWREAFAQPVTGTTGRWTRIARRQEVSMARAFVQARAAALGLTEEEFIRRRMGAHAQVGTTVTPGALLEQRVRWTESVAGRTEPVYFETRNQVMEAMARETNSGDYYYQTAATYDIEDVATGHFGAEMGDWADADELDEVATAGYTSMYKDDWLASQRESGLLRVPKAKAPAMESRGPNLPGYRHSLGRVNEGVEYYDFRTKQWRPVGPIGFERKKPTVPPVADVRLSRTPDGRSYEVLTKQPAGLNKADVDVLMDEDVKGAKRTYTSSHYGVINTAARRVPFVERETGDITPDPWTIPWVIRDTELLDEFTQLGMLTKPTMMYRGININRVEEVMGQKMTVDYKNLKPGDVFDEKAFMSWADDETIADRFVENLGGFSSSVTGTSGVDAVKLYAEFPAGYRLGIIAGYEAEQLVPRNSSWRVLETRVDRDMNPITGEIETVRHITVAPADVPPLPGVNRIGIEEPTYAEILPVHLRQDAITDPDTLRSRAEGDELTLRRAEELIREAQETAPPPGGVTLDDITGLTPEELVAVARSTTDFRDRLSNMLNEVGPHRLSVAMGWAFETGERNSYVALQRLLHETELAWAGSAGMENDTLRALLKGVTGSPATLMGPRGSDVQDVLLGNTSRRIDGRTGDLQPVIVDDLAARAAGYPLGTGGLMEHEQVVIYFNNLKDAANRESLGGRTDWTADEVRALASRRWEQQHGVRDTEMLSGETYDATEISIPVELHGSMKTKRGRPLYDPLMDIIAEPQHQAERAYLVANVNYAIGRIIKEDLGLGYKEHGDLSIGRWGDGTVQPLVGVVAATTKPMARNLADMLGYWLDQEEVWAFTKVANPDKAALEGLAARVGITIPLNPDFPEDAAIQRAMAMANSMAERLGKEGMTIRQLPNNDIQLSIISRDARTVGTEDEVRAMVEAAAEGWSQTKMEWDIDYGELYVARPPAKASGKPDWGAHETTVAERVASRGLDGWDGPRLGGSRTKVREAIRTELDKTAPKQAQRAFLGEPLVPHILEDRRRGNVLGQTAIDENRAIISGFAAADPLTGLHELMHVFAIDLDDSMRQVVQRARLQVLDRSRTDMAARIADYEQKAQAATSARSRAQFLSRKNALQQELGELIDETEWGVEHEEFLVSQFQRWLKTGTNDNPALVPAFQHFRNWVELLWKEIKGGRGGIDVHVSSEMNQFFNDMFKPKGVQTVAHDMDTQVLRMAALQQLGGAWDEAFATHFYKKDRSMLERSINHPYIGLYPASYMWGKVLPELFRFLALRPFGMPTPFLGWNVTREISDTVRTQAETDEGFKQFLKDNEEGWQFFSMFFPGLPNDIPANVPLPWRRIAEQGLEQQVSYQLGEDPTPINYTKGLEDAMFYAVGPAGTVRTLAERAAAVGDAVRGAVSGEPGEVTEPVYIPGR